MSRLVWQGLTTAFNREICNGRMAEADSALSLHCSMDSSRGREFVSHRGHGKFSNNSGFRRRFFQTVRGLGGVFFEQFGV